MKEQQMATALKVNANVGMLRKFTLLQEISKTRQNIDGKYWINTRNNLLP